MIGVLDWRHAEYFPHASRVYFGDCFHSFRQAEFAAGRPTADSQFENEDVKAWKTVVLPHAPLAMHTHEHPRVIIALSGGTMKVVNESGSSEVHRWETGKAYWLSAEEGKNRHADVNQGEKPIEVIVVEVKNAK